MLIHVTWCEVMWSSGNLHVEEFHMKSFVILMNSHVKFSLWKDVTCKVSRFEGIYMSLLCTICYNYERFHINSQVKCEKFIWIDLWKLTWNFTLNEKNKNSHSKWISHKFTCAICHIWGNCMNLHAKFRMWNCFIVPKWNHS